MTVSVRRRQEQKKGRCKKNRRLINEGKKKTRKEKEKIKGKRTRGGGKRKDSGEE